MDLTKIDKPFGLLDAETQEALKAHGGPWEYFGPGGAWRDWTNNTNPWFPELAYRVKPAPPKPREFHINPSGRGFYEAPAGQDPKIMLPPGWLHVREVLE